MLFSKKGRLKKEFDDQLLEQFMAAGREWRRAKRLDELLDDYDGYAEAERKIAESKYLFLLKEARHRQVKIH